MSCPDSTYNGVDIKYTNDCRAPACTVSSDCTAISPNLYCGSTGTCKTLTCSSDSDCPTGKCENGLCVPDDDTGLSWVIIIIFIILAIIGAILAYIVGKAAYKKYRERKGQQ